MARTAHLEEHPPARTQYYPTRRSPVTAIVVHTAENATDLVLPDGGAEAVARFIATRTDAAGSYATVVDSDSIKFVCRYEWTAFHVRGFNSRSLGLSFACRAAQWLTLPDEWVEGAIMNGALEAAVMSRWVHETYGYRIPPVRLTADEARAGQPGFIDHARLDPSRRSDPGPQFPWAGFLARYALQTEQENIPMADNEWCLPANRRTSIEDSQRVLANEGHYHGRIDGDHYTGTNQAVHALKNEKHDIARQLEIAEAALVAARSDLDGAHSVVAELEAKLRARSGSTAEEISEHVLAIHRLAIGADR